MRKRKADRNIRLRNKIFFVTAILCAACALCMTTYAALSMWQEGQKTLLSENIIADIVRDNIVPERNNVQENAVEQEALEEEMISGVTGKMSEVKMVDIYGEWEVSEKMYGGVGWKPVEEDDVWRDFTVSFMPDRFRFGGETVDVAYYVASTHAVEEDGVFRWDPVEMIGFERDYFIKFWLKSEKYFGLTFILLNRTEIMLYSGRALYKLRKIESYEDDKEAQDFYFPVYEYQACYGTWKITEAHGRAADDDVMKEGDIIRLDDKSNEFLRYQLIEEDSIQENSYNAVILNDGEAQWDKAVMIDSMTMRFMKGNRTYLAKRISDPVEDKIYEEIG